MNSSDKDRVSLPADTLVTLINPIVGKAPPGKEIGDFSGGKSCNCAGFRQSGQAENMEFR